MALCYSLFGHVEGSELWWWDGEKVRTDQRWNSTHTKVMAQLGIVNEPLYRGRHDKVRFVITLASQQSYREMPLAIRKEIEKFFPKSIWQEDLL